MIWIWGWGSMGWQVLSRMLRWGMNQREEAEGEEGEGRKESGVG